MQTCDFAPSSSRAHGVVAHLIEMLQGRGQLVSSLPQLVDLTGLTPLAVKRQLEHLADRVIRLPGRPSCFLIVSPAHRIRGAAIKPIYRAVSAEAALAELDAFEPCPHPAPRTQKSGQPPKKERAASLQPFQNQFKSVHLQHAIASVAHLKL
jgi:hypothetical protein